jgi:hypothetical protein
MIHNNYIPFKGKKGKKGLKGKKDNSLYNNIVKNNTNNACALLLKIVIAIIVIVVVKYIYDKFMRDMKVANSKPSGLPKEDIVPKDFNIDLVPSGNQIFEGFDGTTTTSPAPKYINNAEGENVFFGLSSSDQSKLCKNKTDQVVGYRNASSGATFRFQKVDPTIDDTNASYFLLGSVNNGKVIQIDENNNLSLKSKSSTENKQHFKRKSTGTDRFYFVPKSQEDDAVPNALQYEFEYLSLRPVKADGNPYDGQIFIKYTDTDINKLGVSYGIGTPHLDGGDLQQQQPITYVINNTDSGSASQAIANTTSDNSNLNEAVERVLTAFNEYQTQQSANASGTALGNEPLKINLNLGSTSGFANVSNLESFQNLRGVEGFDVRSLLNDYSASMANAEFGNNNLSGIGNTLSSKLQQGADGTSFRGCPTIDRSKYMPKRLAAQCYGCNAGKNEQ